QALSLPPGLHARSQQQPGPQRWRTPVRILGSHLDHVVRAVALAVAAADAGVLDEDLAVRRAVDGVGRTVLHAMRMLAMAARRRHMELRVRRPGLAVESRRALVRVRACLFAMFAADAKALVDQQHVGRLADALLQEIADDVARFTLRFHLHVLANALEKVLLQARTELGIARDGLLEARAVQRDGFGRDRGSHRAPPRRGPPERPRGGR